jgi:hypothetical protein
MKLNLVDPFVRLIDKHIKITQYYLYYLRNNIIQIVRRFKKL